MRDDLVYKVFDLKVVVENCGVVTGGMRLKIAPTPGRASLAAEVVVTIGLISFIRF